MFKLVYGIADKKHLNYISSY